MSGTTAGTTPSTTPSTTPDAVDGRSVYTSPSASGASPEVEALLTALLEQRLSALGSRREQ